MVRESKTKNVEGKDVWKSLLKHRWSSEIIKDSPCLSDDQEYGVILKTAEDVSLDHSANTWVPDEDLAFGKELYSIMKYPFDTAEEAKLSHFFRYLLTNQSLNTVVVSTLRNIQPMAGVDIMKDFSAINMWYERLDTRYNFSLGPVILPLLKTNNLTQVGKLDPPLLKEFKASSQLDSIALVFGEINLVK